MKIFHRYKELPTWRKTLILLCMMLFSVSLVSALSLAAFNSTSSARSTVSVAAWAVDTGLTSADNLTINCNDGGTTTAEFLFEVRNYRDDAICEVDTGYSITVTFPSALPEGTSIHLNGEAGTVSWDKCSYTFSSEEWLFTAGIKDMDLHTLTVTADPDTIQKNFTFENIKIRIHTEQRS